MKKISLWAYRHKWPARFLIVVSFIFLNCLGLFLGNALTVAQFNIPSLWIYATSFVFIVGFISYPSRKEKNRYKNFYRRQKISDFVLVSITFLLVIGFGNHYHLQKNQSPFRFTYVNATAIEGINKYSSTENSIVPKKKNSLIKTWKSKLKENIRRIKKEYKDASPGERTALIILSIIVALGLFLLLMSLSCSLSCAGSDGAALVVGILGTSLIIFLLVRVIKRINRGRPKEPRPAAPNPSA